MSTYTDNNGIEKITPGQQDGAWGATTNNNFDFIDASLDGHVTVTLSSAGSSASPNLIPITDAVTSNGRNRVIIITDGGDLNGTVYVKLTPDNAKKVIFIQNKLTGNRDLIISQRSIYSYLDAFVLSPNNGGYLPASPYPAAVVSFDGQGSSAKVTGVLDNLQTSGVYANDLGFRLTSDPLSDRSGSITGVSVTGGCLRQTRTRMEGLLERVLTNYDANGTIAAFDTKTYNTFVLNQTGNITGLSFSNLDASSSVYKCDLIFIQFGAGNFTVTFPSTFKWINNTVPSAAYPTGRIQKVSLLTYDGGTTFLAEQAFNMY